MSFYDSQESSSTASGPQRKTWDNNEYEERANERMKREQEEEDIKDGKKRKSDVKIKREMLQAREYKLDLQSKVGKSVVINKATPSSESGGFYCDVCDCVMKDSINFLDHVNGKNHQRNMGMSMKVKKSSVDDVKARFAFKKVEKERLKKEERVEAMMEDVHEEEARMKDYKKDKKPEQRKRKADPIDVADLDPDLQSMMGFGGFGTSKK